MAHGGKRESAGRKRGVRNKVSNVNPLDYVLAVIRNPRASPARRDAMAIAAAPYVCPPIAPLDISNLRLIGRLLAESEQSHAAPEKL
jgi:hypothetical protein